MANTDSMTELVDILSTIAPIIREAEGSSELIAVEDMKSRLSLADVAKFSIAQNEVKGYATRQGSTDTDVPVDTVDYYRQLLTKLADKLRNGTDKLDIDEILAKKDILCGIDVQNDEYELVIPEGVTSIGVSAFENRKDITSVIIPDSVKSIGEKAFLNSGVYIELNDFRDENNIKNEKFHHKN